MAENIIERSSQQMYIEDMVKYCIIVDRRRAFPEVRDGLKPVQRRVIYDMFEQGAINGRTKKSAKITGDTMGLYHPHGSCLTGDTPIFLLHGDVIKIEDLYSDPNINSVEILAVDANGNIVPAVAHSFRIGQYTDRKFHIVFSNGAEVVCTSNHPFRLDNGAWVKAEDIRPYTRVYCKTMRRDRRAFNGRLKIDGKLVQNIVYEYYNGPIPSGYHKHHIDGNYDNNNISNITAIPMMDHIMHHCKDQSSLDGLEKGRISMFSENGTFREATIKKNGTLAKLFNQEQGIRKFKYAISVLESRGLPITIENYESLRGEIYNLPIVERIIQRYPQYNCHSFEDLVNIQLPSISEMYKEKVNKIINPISFIEEEDDNIEELNVAHMRAIYHTLDKMIDMNISLDYNNYCEVVQHQPNIDYEVFNQIVALYSIEKPYISHIYTEVVDSEPMYDFTVDGFENMMIPIASRLNDQIVPMVGCNVPMICAHNSSLYSCMVPLTNWWKCKIPILRGQGNWGTIMGDGAAAERYTESCLSDFGYDCIISELKDAKYIVDWKDNYDRTTSEPEFLPVKLPILLINGAFGIGVGLSTNIPTHNLNEVIDVTRKLIRDPNADFILVPDHCQPLTIYDTNWKEINETGYGKYTVRGMIETYEETKGQHKGCPVIRVTSLPDNITTESVKLKVLDLIEKKQLPMIKDVYDASKITADFRVVLKKGSDPNYVIEVLYSKCSVQDSVSVNFEAVDDINPKRFSYREYLLHFINFRATTKFRLYCNKYKDASTRCHKLETYIKVIESGEIDNIVAMVKKQDTINDTILEEYLIKRLNITDLQARFILTTDIRKLSKGYLKKYKEEFAETSKRMAMYKKAIMDDGKIIMNEIDTELAEIAAKYGSPRLCPIVSANEAKNIPSGTFKVVITEKNFIRKVPDNDKIGAVRKDNPKFVLRVDNAENILLFDNKGKAFKLPVHKIPLTEKGYAGTDVRVLIKNCTADIISVFYEPDIEKVVKGSRKQYMTIVTKNNIIKKLDVDDFLNVNLSGLMYSKIRDGEDEVAGIVICPADLDIVIYSKQKALRTHLSEIPLFKRNAAGSKAMSTSEEIEGISVVYPDTQYIVVLTSNGKANKFPIGGLSAHKRGTGGNNVIKLDGNDNIFTIYGACDNDVLKITTSEQILEVPVSEIKSKSGVASGQKVVNSKEIIVRCDLLYNKQ